MLNEQGILGYKATLTHDHVSKTEPDIALTVLADRLVFDMFVILYFSYRRGKTIVGKTVLILNIMFYIFKPT